MDIVARELRTRCNLIVYSASWFSLPLPDAVAGQFSAQEHRFGIHAGEIETSMMLHLAPATVQMQHAQNFRSTSQDRSERYAILGNGKSASWAGRCRTTTRRAPWVTRPQPRPTGGSGGGGRCSAATGGAAAGTAGAAAVYPGEDGLTWVDLNCYLIDSCWRMIH